MTDDKMEPAPVHGRVVSFAIVGLRLDRPDLVSPMMSRAEIITRLREIADRLSTAPARTEASAKREYAARMAEHPRLEQITHYPHQVGGLEQICTSSASDLEALIRRLESDGAL